MKGKDGAAGKNATEILVTTEEFSSDENCPSGGKRLLAAPDKNLNGKIDADELAVAKSVTSCNPVNPIVTTKPTPTTSCPLGGVTVVSGRDLNGDGKLDDSNPAEKSTISTTDICSAKDGKDAVPLVTAIRSPNSNPYSFGCQQQQQFYRPYNYSLPILMLIIIGQDTNANNILDPAEELSAKHTIVCPGRSENFTYYDLNPSDDIFKTSVAPGKTAGSIDITIDLNPDKITLDKMREIIIARKEGPTANDSCYDDGAFKMAFDSSEFAAVGSQFQFTDMVVPGSTYSYTICPRNSVLSWTRKIEGVKAGDGSVVCSHTLMLTEPKFVSYDVGGLSGADLECSAAMGASEKSRAVLSSATGDAKDRIKINGPICNTEGRVIAVDAKHFFSRPFSNLISFTKTSSEQTDMYSYRHIMSASKAGGTREESLPPDFEWSVWLPRSTGLYSVEYNYPAGANASLYSRAFPSKDYYGSKALNDSIPMSLMCISGQ